MMQKIDNSRPEVIATFNGSVGNLKVTHLDSNTIALVLTGLATPSGELYNSENVEKPLSTGKVYTKLFVRHWDNYVTENTSAIWYTTLKKSQGARSMVVAPLRNALAGHSVSLESPVPPFGGKGDFDVSKNGIVFVAKDPKLNDATTTKSNLYYIPLKTFTETRAPSPQLIKTGNLKGYSGSPVFSPDAKSIAFTRMQSQQYESDKPRLLLLPDITDLSNVQEFYETSDGEGRWDLKPEDITWSEDGEELYVTAEENGRGKLFKLPASPRRARDLPVAITTSGAVESIKVLPSNRLLVSSSSLVDNSIWSVLNPAKPSEKTTISSSFKGGKSFGISQDQVDEFWYTGAEDQEIHAWLIKPSNFDRKKKYPLAYLIHGGVSLVPRIPTHSHTDTVQASRSLERKLVYALESSHIRRARLYCRNAQPNRKFRLRHVPSKRHKKQLGRPSLHRPRKGLRIHRIQPALCRHLTGRCFRRFLRWLHDQLDPRTRPGPEVQSPRHSRWCILYFESVCE